MINIPESIAKIFQHINLSNTIYYYVNKNGNDAFDGLTPKTAKLTITAGINSLSLGDRLIISAGDYYEDIDVNIDNVQIIGEWGLSIFGTITISANATIFDNGLASPTIGNGWNVTGNLNFFNSCTSLAGEIGFNITGNTNQFVDCFAIGHTQTAYNISNFNVILQHCITGGTGGNTRGFYLSNSAAHDCLFEDCLSNNNANAGFELVKSCILNIFRNCISGSGDGKKIDANDTNIWVNFEDELPQQHYEFIYPSVSGLGVASLPIIVNNSTTDGAGGTTENQDYWGDVIRIIPKNQIIQEYKFYGINIYAVTSDKDLMWELLFTNGIMANQNGGNDWDKNETVITVDDASEFMVDDWIWLIGDDRPDGEILIITNIASNVITVEREANVIVEDGLRYDYDTSPGNNKIYLVHRPSNTLYHKIENSFSASSARDFIIFSLFEERTISANGACIMRMCNGNDNLPASFEVRARGEI